MKAYVILERSYSYNDEIHTPEAGGSVLKIFKDKVKVQKELKKRIKDWFSSEDLTQYCYDLDELFNNSKEALVIMGKAQFDYNTFNEDFQKLSENQKEKMISLFHNSRLPFYIQEMEISE